MTDFDIPGFLRSLTQRAGVYRMYADDEELLYVGKAKNLKNRVSSYFRARGLNTKTVALVARIAKIEVTVTGSEAEALLLEQTLIKKHRPQYNILLKDDKSYPYLHLSDHAYPLLAYRRGKRRRSGQYFGPYPNGAAVKEAQNYLQRLFLLRNCEDSYFNHRSRPCLQYEIKRCSAPCVGMVTQDEYARDIQRARMFLEGKSLELVKDLQAAMAEAAEDLQFEKAAEYRDRVDLLRRIQEKQSVDSGDANADVWVALDWQSMLCVQRLTFRGGRLTNSQSFFPENPAGDDVEEVLVSYLEQFYIGEYGGESPPETLVVDVDGDRFAPLISVLQQRGQRLRHQRGVRGESRQWLAMAGENARAGIQGRLSGHQAASGKLARVADLLGMSEAPGRIECFDISHSQGEEAYASCVVYGGEGLDKSRYRRFSVRHVTAGDDYAALEDSVRRHLTKMQEKQDLPGLLLIDGGKGQVSRVAQVTEELGIPHLEIWGISKGTTRKSGWEFLWRAGADRPVTPDAHDEGFRLLQFVRDEAHRFAITGHRKARAKKRGQSDLEALPGVGPKRRRELLLHFGSLRNMRGAPREEFEKVPGISKSLAAKIFATLHGEEQE
ncbi:excinuclease ABC subunit UvrC [uncultured Thalassolituus sp.]|uniref:excinuclease ABC subunit UvrC n=1 Tax=Thalassolituus sp. TaxID=2030822 RepID=UPI002605B754|nr:excinuclease ABC subunit UvrC [uncultured Thalassolituus sp.]